MFKYPLLDPQDEELKQHKSLPLKALSQKQVIPMELQQKEQQQIQRQPNIQFANLQIYKKKMFLTVSIILGFLGLIISERLFNQIVRSQEIGLIIKIQKALKISYIGDDGSYYSNQGWFIKAISQLEYPHYSKLIQLHFFITHYVSFDAIMTIKIMYPVLFGEYVISILQLIYREPRPFWVSIDIVSLTCQKNYSSPADAAFFMVLILFYSTFLYSDKAVMSTDIQMLVGPQRMNRRRLITRIVGSLLISSYLLCIYIGGLVFIDNIVLGLIYCGLYLTVLRLGSGEVNNMIRRTALISDVSKKMIFKWMFGLGILQMVVTVIHNFSDRYPKVEEVQNFLYCLMEEEDKDKLVPLFDIMGPNATFCQSSLVLAFIGLIFGVSYTFRNCQNSMHWFQGSNKKRIMRAIIANLCLIPSWILILSQSYFLQQKVVYESGLSEFLLDSIHQLFIYFFLFGILPTNIFERFHLNQANSTINLQRVEKEKGREPFSFID